MSNPERQIELVYQQLARTAGFRGFGPRFLYSIGAVAAICTVLFSAVSRFIDLQTAVLLWTGAAITVAAGVVALVLVPSVRSTSAVENETAREVVRQFSPALGLGAAVTAVVLLRYPQALSSLPVMWLVAFGFGVSALAPLLFGPIHYAVIGYFVAAAAAFFFRSPEPRTFVLLVGVPFSVLHVATGLIVQSCQATGQVGGKPHE